MAKLHYDSKKTVSKQGRIGWSMTPLGADGNIAATKPVIYCAGATSQAEALAMIAGAGRSSFKQETVTETGTFVSYRYGTIVELDINTTAGLTRAERMAQILATKKPAETAKGKLEKSIK